MVFRKALADGAGSKVIVGKYSEGGNLNEHAGPKEPEVRRTRAMQTRGSALRQTAHDVDDENEEDEDEDALLETLLQAFHERLAGSVEEASLASGPAEEEAEAPDGASRGSNERAADANGFVLLDDHDPDRRLLEAELERTGGITWAPTTGFPLDEVAEAGSSQGRRGQGRRGRAAEGRAAPPALEPQLEQQLLAPPRDPKKEAREARKLAPQTAGPQWYNLPATAVTPELKQELRLLRLRGVMDPKRHYRAPDSTKFPKHFQVGTVVEGAADFYSGRITKKDRKTSFAAELLADESLKHYRKRKYNQLQEQKQAGSRKWYKYQKDRQKPNWARK
eukprot:jgi/Mesen1/11024/ME000098S10419